MHRFASFVCLIFLILFSALAFGVETAPVVVTTPEIITGPDGFSRAMLWAQNNQVIVGAMLAAILDFIFAINPKWKANGILEFLYNLTHKGQNQQPPAV
jgi:hypothetical protein